MGNYDINVRRDLFKHFVCMNVLVLKIPFLSGLGHNKIFHQHLEVGLFGSRSTLLSLKHIGVAGMRFTINWGEFFLYEKLGWSL